MSRKAIERECERIREVQIKVYEGIKFRQKQMEKQIEKTKSLQDCEQLRAKAAKAKNMQEQVTHPYNDRGGMWMYLANCMSEEHSTDLEAIRQRQVEREAMRRKVAEQKQMEREMGYEEEGGFEEKEMKGKEKVKVKEIPWKLMRKMREQDVRENKKRMEKMKENQLRNIKVYHK